MVFWLLLHGHSELSTKRLLINVMANVCMACFFGVLFHWFQSTDVPKFSWVICVPGICFCVYSVAFDLMAYFAERRDETL